LPTKLSAVKKQLSIEPKRVREEKGDSMEKKRPLEETHLPLADHHILGEREREKNFDQKKILGAREISELRKILEQKKVSETIRLERDADN
jgi:hypothetical protein